MTIQRPSKTQLRVALEEMRELSRNGHLRGEPAVALGRWLADISKGDEVVIQASPSESFGAVREEFWGALNEKDPIDCPCCGQTAKIYPRTIHSGMARVLIRLYREAEANGGDWVYVKEGIYTRGSSGDYGKLRFWGLIEGRDVRTSDENSSGHWRITDSGKRFVLGQVTVPKYALIYDNECRGHRGEQVSIRDCLGVAFDYEKLMRGE